MLNDAKSRNCFKDAKDDEDMFRSYRHLERFSNQESDKDNVGESSAKRMKVT